MQNENTDATPDWDQRAASLRAMEWQTANDLLTAARRLLLAHAARHQRVVSLHEITRMIDLASKLGRLSTELDVDDGMQGRNRFPIPLSIKQAVERIYGPSPSLSPAAETPKLTNK